MRVEIAQFAVTALFVVPGLALLVATRVIAFRATEIAAAIGLAYLAGMAAVITLSILLLTLGVSMTAPLYLLLAALLTGALAARPVAEARRARPTNKPSRGRPTIADLRAWFGARSTAWWIASLTVSAIAVFGVLGYISATMTPVVGWDGWSIWARKGLMLFYNGSLPKEFFQSDYYFFMQPDYPLLVPVWESIFFRFAGAPDTQAVHAQFWILLLAALWAAGFLAHRAAPAIRGSKEWAAAIWAPLLGMVLLTPTVYQQTLQIYADIPMAVFALGAAFCCATWIETRRSGYLVLAAVLLGGLANIKNEGLVTAMAILGGLLLVRMFKVEGSRWRSIKPALLAAGYTVLALLPWRIWTSVNHVEGLVSISDGLSPAYIWENKERLSPSVAQFANQLITPGLWTFIPTIAISLAVACLIIGVGRRVATFYAIVTALTMAGVLWGYVIAPTVLAPHLNSSINRLVDGFVLICMAAVLHLTVLLGAAGAGVFAGTDESSASADAPPTHD